MPSINVEPIVQAINPNVPIPHYEPLEPFERHIVLMYFYMKQHRDGEPPSVETVWEMVNFDDEGIPVAIDGPHITFEEVQRIINMIQ